VGGGTGATITWSQLTGPTVAFTNGSTATAGFTAPNADTVVVVRVTVTNGTSTVSADQVINVGTIAPATAATGCTTGSVLDKVFSGSRVLLVGTSSTVLLGDVTGATGACSATASLTHSGTDVNLFGFILGDDLSGTIDATKICFSAGTVRLASAFDLPPITIGAIPLCLVYSSVGGGPGAVRSVSPGLIDPARTQVCDFPLLGELAWQGDVPFVTLPTGLTPGTTVLDVDCDRLRLTSSATVDGGGTLAFDGTIDVTGAGTTTITAQGVELFGGTVGGAITVGYGSALTVEGALEIVDPDLPFGDGVQLDRLALAFKDRTFKIDGQLTVGAAEPRLRLNLSGSYTSRTNFTVTLKAATTSAWTPTPGLTVGAASIVGTVTRTLAGGLTFDVTGTASGTWAVVAGVTVRSVTVQVGNAAPPAQCSGIPTSPCPGRAPSRRRSTPASGCPAPRRRMVPPPVIRRSCCGRCRPCRRCVPTRPSTSRSTGWSCGSPTSAASSRPACAATPGCSASRSRVGWCSARRPPATCW
jgi:hypothetical protein